MALVPVPPDKSIVTPLSATVAVANAGLTVSVKRVVVVSSVNAAIKKGLAEISEIKLKKD